MACLECALVGVSPGSYQPSSGWHALARLLSGLALSCLSWTTSCPNPLAEGQHHSLPGHLSQGQPQPWTLHQEPPRNSLPRASSSKTVLRRCCGKSTSRVTQSQLHFFPPSAILLRFLTFKPICQLLLSVLPGSCWLNP